MNHAKITIAVMLMMLAGCVNTRISDQARNDLGRTGVVSLLGNTFHGTYMGTTIFNDSSYDADASYWNIDLDTSEYVRAKLTADGIHAEDLDLGAADRERFRRNDKGEFYRRNMTVEENYDDLCRVALRQGYDTLIIIVGAGPNENGPPLKPGYGLFVRTLLGISKAYPYAQFMIRVVDVKTEKQLARKVGPAAEATPSRTIAWKSSFDEFSAEEKTALKSDIEGQMRHEIDRMLIQLNVDSAKTGS